MGLSSREQDRYEKEGLRHTVNISRAMAVLGSVTPLPSIQRR